MHLIENVLEVAEGLTVSVQDGDHVLVQVTAMIAARFEPVRAATTERKERTQEDLQGMLPEGHRILACSALLDNVHCDLRFQYVASRHFSHSQSLSLH
jgi:hypothetical protein